MSQDTNHIEELFRSKLEHLESPVDANLWNSIQSELSTNAVASSAAKTGMSILGKSAIVGAIVVTVGASLLYFSDNKEVRSNNQITENKGVNFGDYSDTSDMVNDNSNIKVEEEVILSLNSTPKIVVKPFYQAVDSQPSLQDNSVNFPLVDSNIAGYQVVNIDVPIVNEAPVSAINTAKVGVIEESKIVVKEEVLMAPMQLEKTSINVLPNVYLLSNSGAFKIEYTGSFKDFSMTILDSNQNPIFRSDRPDFEWFGENLYGDKVSPGDYLYLIIAVDKDNNKIQKYQTLKILP